ncbi:Hypothetical protein A7982_05357 [Minicystis rosea]|nr:Hypothetical protein A7982_05357 [Minicystis rosea]
MSRFTVAVGSLALATSFSAPALAQNLGAGVGVTVPGVHVGGQVTVGIPQFQAPPAPVPVYQEPVYQDPQPVVVRRGYYAPRPVHVRTREPNWGAEKLGLDLRVDGAAGFGGGKYGNAYGMGGGGLGLRYRALPHLGFEAGIDLLGGRDFNDRKRLEVAGTAGALLFLNPRSRAQLYLSGGVLLDHARANDIGGPGLTVSSRDLTYTHLGGYAGLGLEVFLTRRISLHVDGRGVVRQAIGGNTNAPEFTDPVSGRTTNTSGGFIGSGGIAFYF